MPRPEQTTLVNQVFDRIFDLLVSGEIPLGGVVNEAALAERFCVSRGPVREAVKQFQGRGLVIKEPYLKARVVELSVSDMIEIFQLREAVEGMSVRLATLNMSDAELDELVADFSQPRPDSAEVLDVHVRIAEGSGNARIRALLCDELYYLLRLYRARSGDMPGRRENAYAEHWQILRAMKTRDADLAESLMRAHILRATKSLQELLAKETTALAAIAKGDAR
ncbi:GntR family transcriptional regulator [Roseovarius sp. ZX-A-9]|uniref:GntR family transcriptional regulator n=1 Tax=Roseovarius sp. ZX-A-9 TaxID=3014783 RepID=UPI00232C69B8|nr:GntR family transcriptional regulator [Roseovarius sp. ZX-A-9]